MKESAKKQVKTTDKMSRKGVSLMRISIRGRYALRVMLDLAEHVDQGFIPMKEIAGRQGVSLKYMEQIMPALSKNRLVEGLHGKGGGYRLSRLPGEYTVGEVLRLTEGDLTPVACLECGTEPCARKADCKTISMWNEFYEMTNQFFDGITLTDLLEKPKGASA